MVYVPRSSEKLTFCEVVVVAGKCLFGEPLVSSPLVFPEQFATKINGTVLGEMLPLAHMTTRTEESEMQCSGWATGSRLQRLRQHRI